MTVGLFWDIFPKMMQRKSATKPRVGQALTAAVERVLRPLFRILLRNHMSFKAFVDIAKHVYVDVAAEDFGIPGKKTSVSGSRCSRA